MRRRIVIVRHPWSGAAGRRAWLVVALAVAGLVLDRAWPLGGPPARVQFFAIFVAIASAVAHFIHGAADVTIAFLVTAWQVLRTGFVALGRVVKTGIFDLGKMGGKLWDGVKFFAVDIVPKFLRWTYDKLLRFSAWLKEKFAPVFKWLNTVKEHIDSFYKTFVRPIVDTIDFIRAVNRVLVAFHIDLLQSLDSVLAQIEQRIEAPFLWVRQKIVFLENWLDRIVTLDGFFQRLTLLASMAKYAPAWMRIATNKRTKPLTSAQSYAIERAKMIPTVSDVIADGRRAIAGEESNIGPVIDEAIARARAYLEAA
jgi:hypothetical protein